MKQKYGNILENRFFSTQKTALPRGGARKERAAHNSLCQPRNRAEPRATSRACRGALSPACMRMRVRRGVRWARGGACVAVRVCVCRACRRVRAGRAAEPPILPKSVDPSVFPPYLQEGVRINMRGYAARRPAKHFSANEKKDYTVSRCPAPGGCGRAVKGRKLPSGIPGLPPGTYILYPVRKNFSRRQI